ncbi:DUF1571 domain-containing protein [Mariniblastus fucicola]|uniref:DUF1571 domain-containing protein n=1 Tax=Mariniblastus fucicola TaxID=980251 RepID=A0A5B9P6N9_9BACT|nr:DUF1571 domain-containing protein [Mariniblastus fucicola]QEG20672.1 hypothetical protein MFFC18_05220 [Mariniblastus fucicola]
MTDSELKTDSSSPGESQTPKRPNWVGCIAIAVIALLVLAAGLVVVQSMLVPDVEDDSTVEIQTSNDDAGSDVPQTDGDDSDHAASDSTLPDEADSPKRLTDTISMQQVETAEHPLDPLMAMANRGLELIDTRYAGYSAKMLTQVRTGNTLHEENLMFVKVRHDQTLSVDDEQVEIPFSIYTRFLKPKSKVGQEAIWVRGQNKDLILGHGTGLLNFKTVRLDPMGSFAMTGNRYPIYQIGFRNLIIKMKEFGENDRKYDECDVQIDRNIKVDGRPCTMLTITHPVPREHFEYHIAKIYIDDEYEIPTGYEGYLWPTAKGEEPPLLEKYFYLDLDLNCDLKDVDFDITNPDYEYPSW